MKRILVGVDGSKESRQAAAFAADLAQAMGAALLVADAVFVPVESFGVPDIVAHAWDWKERERTRALGTTKEIASAIAAKGVEVETVVPIGAPAQALADLALDAEVGLVVVGHRGHGGAVARFLLGSVADRLVQISPKSVLVVR